MTQNFRLTCFSKYFTLKPIAETPILVTINNGEDAITENFDCFNLMAFVYGFNKIINEIQVEIEENFVNKSNMGSYIKLVEHCRKRLEDSLKNSTSNILNVRAIFEDYKMKFNGIDDILKMSPNCDLYNNLVYEWPESMLHYDKNSYKIIDTHTGYDDVIRVQNELFNYVKEQTVKIILDHMNSFIPQNVSSKSKKTFREYFNFDKFDEKKLNKLKVLGTSTNGSGRSIALIIGLLVEKSFVTIENRKRKKFIEEFYEFCELVVPFRTAGIDCYLDSNNKFKNAEDPDYINYKQRFSDINFELK
ncbi:hypothetical protein [Namhaeicola litoreus]|uniref:Uncharacterized protein n=1 Tax=Namhaeicola litoreus TaxID=1052145 RepID=A0ABW3XXE0_9FLAO